MPTIEKPHGIVDTSSLSYCCCDCGGDLGARNWIMLLSPTKPYTDETHPRWLRLMSRKTMSRHPAFDTIVVAARRLQEQKKALHCFSVMIPRMSKQIHAASGDMVVKHSVHGRSKVCTSIYIPLQPFLITHSRQHLLHLPTSFLSSCFLYTITFSTLVVSFTVYSRSTISIQQRTQSLPRPISHVIPLPQ